MATAMAVAVIRPGYAIGADLHDFLLLKNVVLGLFWSFQELPDLKDASGLQFYAGKWYREVWKSKFNLFYEKTVKRYQKC